MESKNITINEAKSFINKLPNSIIKENIIEHLSGEWYNEEGEYEPTIILYDGDLTLESLDVEENIIVVNGNLKVVGNIEDCVNADMSFLFVLGNLESDNLFTFSQICVIGNLTIKNAIIADSGGDYSLDVGGNLKSNIIFENGHTFSVESEIVANDIFINHSDLTQNLEEEDLNEEIRSCYENGTSEIMNYIKKGNYKFRK